MSTQLRTWSLGLLVALTSSLLLGAGASPAVVGDRDCGDFASQRSAQIFFLKHGGPQSDPHRLDADGDGVACETNPAPYYFGTSLPGSAPAPVVRSTVRLAVGPSRAIAGERLKLRVQVLPKVKRAVVVQRQRPGGGWARVAAAQTRKNGRVTIKSTVRPSSTVYRATVTKKKANGKRYTAARSPQRRVLTQTQSVVLSMPNASVTGTRVAALATVAPARAGRAVALQRLTGGRWKALQQGRESGSGRVQFTVRPVTDGLYRYRAVVQARAGARAIASATEKLRATTPTPTDHTPPPVPTGLVATAGDGGVALHWTPVADEGLAGYVVYRSTNSGATWVETARVGTPTTSVTGLTNGTEYTFAVTAVDTSNNESTLSLTAAATPRDTTPPEVPFGLQAVPGNGQVELTWQAVASPDLAGYRVYRRVSPDGPWTQDNSTLATAAEYTATGLANDTSYDFAVSAVDATGNESSASDPSSAVPTAPDITPPAVPSGLSATPGDGQVSLTWSAVDDPDLVGYRLYLRPTAAQEWTEVPNGLTATTMATVTDLTNGVVYDFAVTSLDTLGNESAKSDIATSVPLALPPAP